MPNFGPQSPRPGGEPPPRRQLSPEELRVRETFNRADHLAGKTTPAPEPQSARVEPIQAFDESAVRAKLNQLGLDFQIFPIGEKPADPGGRNQRHEARVKELESERTIIRNRMLISEQSAADAISDVRNITIERDTLLKELETLKSAPAQEAR